MTPTTRRHPRTLAEAWQRPPAPSGGAWGILGPYRRPPGRIRRALPWLVGVGMILAGALARWAPGM